MRLLLCTLTASLLAITTCNLHAQRISADGAMQTFDVLSNQYFDEFYFPNAPTSGTAVGYHQFDTRLEDYSAAARAKQIAGLHDWEKKFEEIPADGLDASVAVDREILLNSIRSQLLTLEVIRPLDKNPDAYSSGVTNSIFVLMERPFAPSNVRLRDVIARERLIPQVFEEAKKNLHNPAKISTEIALEQIDGIVSFFQSDVPSAFNDATDRIAKLQFAKTNATVIQVLKDYSAWMKSDLLLRSNGDFRLGADNYRKKLLYDEMVDTPLDRLLAVNEVNMRQNRAEFARVAKELDPNKTPVQVLAELATIHPAPDKLLDAFRDSFAAEIAFIKDHHIITLPNDERPVLQETPPFMRATTSASMDPPGPFETRSTKAYFNVTLPDKNWTPEHIAEHMAEFNVGTIVSTSVHEAYPGHFTQFLWQGQFPSRVRKLIGANTNVEGWAHYTEQMMLDEGFQTPGADARTQKLIRLGQLQDALLRNARFTVGIKMHTEGWSTEQAEQYFVTEGYQSPSVAKMETKRGTSDPTYLYYTLGKLEILKLRVDLKAKQGAAFNLQQFHDNFMRLGPVPIKIMRQAMLHDNSPVL
ncbi:DUF885 domain-containing protein [Terriglobus sp. RCC_193]|uniref:DUF885 domain-containing protein n=1 Tax=Terriglobus sp. RCC_193 TaxID=3239218 RepID=UPI003524DABE